MNLDMPACPDSPSGQAALMDEALRAHRAVQRLTIERRREIEARAAALTALVDRHGMSRVELARRLGVAGQRIGQMIRDGLPRDGR